MKPPDFAARIWSAGNSIYLELNDPGGGDRKHVVKLPHSNDGLSQILKLLSHRGSKSKIATSGDPTQHQIDLDLKSQADKFLAKRKPQFKATEEQSQAAKEVLRSLGML